MVAGNARNEITSTNSVNVITTNGDTAEQFAVNDPFAYAQAYIAQQNIAR